MNVRHLLEKHKLSRQLFKEVNKWLTSTGMYLKEGTIVDATIIQAASVHDITETENLLHGEETFISADSGYRGAQKKVEPPFRIIKRQFGLGK